MGKKIYYKNCAEILWKRKLEHIENVLRIQQNFIEGWKIDQGLGKTNWNGIKPKSEWGRKSNAYMYVKERQNKKIKISNNNI